MIDKNTDYEREISIYRSDVDLIDRELISLIERRMDKAKAIGLLKKKYKLEVLDNNRELYVLESRVSMLKDKSYEKAIKDIFAKIMEVSRSIQI